MNGRRYTMRHATIRPISLTNSVFDVFCRSTIMVLGAFLDSFQKIADAATNTKGKKNHIVQCQHFQCCDKSQKFQMRPN